MNLHIIILKVTQFIKYKINMTIEIIIAITILVILVIITLYYLYHTINILFFPFKKAPYIPSFNRQLELMKQLDIKPNSTLVDLWCWDWKALRFFIKEHNIKLWEWFDINSYAIVKGKIINKIKRINNINLYKKDFFKADLKKYDYIYLYLWDTQLKAMEDRIRKEKKEKTIIISNSFKFTKHKPFNTIKKSDWIDDIFLYK